MECAKRSNIYGSVSLVGFNFTTQHTNFVFSMAPWALLRAPLGALKGLGPGPLKGPLGPLKGLGPGPLKGPPGPS